MRYLGIDYGTKCIGLALSDEGGSMGFPYGVIQNTERTLKDILALIKKENVGVVVLGESHDLDGTANPIQKKIEHFAEQLQAEGIEIVLEPEYYTTKEARDAQALYGKKSHSTERVDASAAAIILNSYLERHGNNR